MDSELGSSSGGETGFIKTSMKHKSLFITGSTGFLAKVFMEKVLRVQPQVKKLYLLLRAEDTKSAKQRFQEEVIGKEVFRVLREQHGEAFDSFISSKVVPLAGDISLRNLGIKDFNLEEQMFREIDFIINVAATTNFHERYDVALNINTLGAKHVCEFAKKCQKLELLLHVSTVYVTREKEGLIFETLPLRMGEITNQNSTTLNLEMELKIAKERLQQLQEEEKTEEDTITSMKKLGLERARLHGWSNTYMFTKAMGEMFVAQLGENHVAPVVIVRPSYITSTYKQPFPGWIEGSNAFEFVVQNYAKGEWTHFVADPNSTFDVIPGDMVVNVMMVALNAHSRHQNHHQKVIIYHVGSSTRNRISYSHVFNWASDYFSMNPLLDIDEKPIRVPRLTILPSMDSFSKYEILQYKLPLEALRAVSVFSFNKSFADIYRKLNRQHNRLIRILEVTEPYVLFTGIFNDTNLKKLEASMREEDDQKDFDFDPKHINWEDYFKNVHFPMSTKILRFNDTNLKKLEASMREEEDQKDFNFDPKHINWDNFFKNVHFPTSTKHAFGSSNKLARSRL